MPRWCRAEAATDSGIALIPDKASSHRFRYAPDERMLRDCLRGTAFQPGLAEACPELFQRIKGVSQVRLQFSVLSFTYLYGRQHCSVGGRRHQDFAELHLSALHVAASGSVRLGFVIIKVS